MQPTPPRRSSVLLAVLALTTASAPAVAQPEPAAESSTGQPGAAAPVVDERSTAELLAAAKTLYEDLEYDKVIPLTEAALTRTDLTVDQELDAYLLQGSSLAIVGNEIDAERPFRLLLKGRPDYSMPEDTPPKILNVFKIVQVREREIAEREARIQREQTIRDMRIRGDDPVALEGGLPVVFNYSLKDPSGAAESFAVNYRRQGEDGFSALALKRDEDGSWVGRIPGDWTANEDGVVLEYYLETRDEAGALVTRGDKTAPLSTTIAPGSADRPSPPPLPLWAFIGAATGSGALALATLGLGAAYGWAQVDYWATVGRAPFPAPTGVIEGSELNTKARTGTVVAVCFWTAVATTAVAAASTGVVALFTNWTGEEEPEY